jgi:gluconolactonase
VGYLERFTRRNVLTLGAATSVALLTESRNAIAAQARVIQRLPNDGPMPPGPYPRIEKFDAGLDEVVTGEPPQILATGLGNGGGCEGPLWWKEGGYLLFCENGRRGKYTPGQGASVADPAARNGALTRDPQGRLVATEGQARRVTRIEPDGTVTVVAEKFQGKPLNSPNDLVVHSDGAIYFTDPTFMPRELGFNATYRVSPDLKRIDLLVDTLDFPNGIALSPDEKTLYIADGVNLQIKAFDILPNGLLDLKSERVAADVHGPSPGRPDGFKVDSAGNIHTSGSGGTFIVSPAGKHLGRIITEEFPINMAFGGDDWKTLFIVTRTTLCAVKLKIPGESVPARRV